LALCWHSPTSEISFRTLALRLARVGSDCDESCAHGHDAHACGHLEHTCGCPHSDAYDFDWELPDELTENWSDRALAGLLQFLSHLPGALPAEEIERRLEWWWRGENRKSRRAMGGFHRRICERGRGVLVNRLTLETVRARCKSWRDCEVCAWAYGREVERLLNQVKGLRAFVVFTMPPDGGDWSNKDHLAAQAKAKRRLAERLFRKFGRRSSMVWTREHNTHLGGAGRLHLNVAWDIDWLDQRELSEIAEACGFGRVVDIRRIRGDARGVTRYAAKCLRYASKDLRTQADWPKGTRRWGASRVARAQMKRPESNPDWYWSPVEPPKVLAPTQMVIFLAPESQLPRRYTWQTRLEGGVPPPLRVRAGPPDGAWAPRGPDGELLTRGLDGKFRLATE
jgi:hypothetical protein